MFGPAAAAISRQRRLDKALWAGLGLDLGRPHWSIVALTAVVAMAIVPLTMLVVHGLGDVLGMPAFGHVEVSHDRASIAIGELAVVQLSREGWQPQLARLREVPAYGILGFALAASLLAACAINMPFMLGEELGWRG
jgi:hypothetical protein